MKRITHGLIALALLAGCSSMSVHTDYDPETEFASFKTFQYQESDTRVANAAPLVDRRIVSAIRSAMVASGLTEVETAPDVFVTYYGSTQEQVQFSTMYTGVSGWGGRGRMMGMGVGGSTTTARTFERGTLVVDVWDAEESELIWRGVIEDTLSDNPERNTAMIDRGIERAFRDFPPS